MTCPLFQRNVTKKNHFIEIQRCEAMNDMVARYNNKIGIMLHSGSRNLGARIANYYHLLAVGKCNQWGVDLPHQDLAFLPASSDLGKAYIRDMTFALKYAMENRTHMMLVVMDALCEIYPNVAFKDEININHNYADKENHFGHNVWVHRKGATLARKGTIGLIPGSQGNVSYIVRGLGEKDSFMSCSHGAGRKMGRRDACRLLNAEEEAAKMGDVVFDSWDTTEVKIDGKKTKVLNLEEAPGSYKNIDDVMEAQTDLVEPLVRLHPLGGLKDKKVQGR